jgi:hypothetical protein
MPRTGDRHKVVSEEIDQTFLLQFGGERCDLFVREAVLSCLLVDLSNDSWVPGIWLIREAHLQRLDHHTPPPVWRLPDRQSRTHRCQSGTSLRLTARDPVSHRS